MADVKLKKSNKDKKNKEKVLVDKADVEALEKRLNALEKIQAEKLKPKSEVRTTGKKLFPLAVGGFFAVCSGFAVYGLANAARFYFDYGDVSSLLVTLLMLFSLFALIGVATWAIHKSEWGYNLRYALILMIVASSAIGFGAVLMQGPVERFIDKVGITDRLRTEERLFGDSTVYGNISRIESNKIEIRIMGGGNLSVNLDSGTRVFPNGTKLNVGQRVGVILESNSNSARWIRVLPANHSMQNRNL